MNKKNDTKKASVKKTPVKKPIEKKKVPAKKVPAKKVAVKKTETKKKVVAKKTPVKKTATKNKPVVEGKKVEEVVLSKKEQKKAEKAEKLSKTKEEKNNVLDLSKKIKINKNEVLLDVQNITNKKKGVFLDKISFKVMQGEMHAIIGPNGAGKSTLIKSLLGIIPCKTRDAFYYGEKLKNRNIKIQYVPDKVYIPRDLKVRQYINDYFMVKYGQHPDLEDGDFDSVRSILNNKMQYLSGGELRKVSLMCSLLGESKLIFLDEPLTNLDKFAKDEIIAILKKAKQNGKTIVIISHDIDRLGVICDNFTLIAKGEVARTNVATIKNIELAMKKVGWK